MTENTGSHKGFFQKIHIPTLVICLGCVLTASFGHRGWGTLVCREWAVLSMLLTSVWGLFRVLGNKRMTLCEDDVAKTFFLIGIIESAIAFLQLAKVLASCNSLFRFTGSFTNPSMLAILLSMCILIGLYYARQSRGKDRVKWVALTSLQVIFLVLCTSRMGIMAVLCSHFILFVKPATNEHLLWKAHRKVVFPVLILVPLLIALYYVKNDSANGRILIWTNCIHMIMDKPITGWGTDGFDAHYMPYQAAYFMQHPGSAFSILADNISHPFNEYLLFAVKYGLPGLTLLLFALGGLLKILAGSNSNHKKLFICICMVIGICAMFSYPYKMPVIWVVSTYIICQAITSCNNHRMARATFMSFLILILLFKSMYRIRDEWKWTSLMDNPTQESSEKILQEYHRLYKGLHTNSYFLYNYGAVLHHQGKHCLSNKVLDECARKYNDYNVQMLIADNYRELGKHREAIGRFSYAGHMIPCRFLPLYYKMETYKRAGDIKNACRMAKEILQKPVKIKNSPAIEEIRRKATQLTEAHGNE